MVRWADAVRRASAAGRWRTAGICPGGSKPTVGGGGADRAGASQADGSCPGRGPARYGKSDPIDALAVARAALREPGSAARPGSTARPGAAAAGGSSRGPGRRSGPLHQPAALAPPRARPGLGSTARVSWSSYRTSTPSPPGSQSMEGPVARIAAEIVAHVRELTVRETDARARDHRTGPADWHRPARRWSGWVPLTAAKIVAETADVRRFKIARTRSPATTAPHRCRCGPATANATASPAPATGNSTPPSTASRSPRCAATPTPAPTSSVASPTATPRPKPCEPSSDASPTSSTEPPRRRPTRDAATCIATGRLT